MPNKNNEMFKNILKILYFKMSSIKNYTYDIAYIISLKTFGM